MSGTDVVSGLINNAIVPRERKCTIQPFVKSNVKGLAIG